MLVIAVRRVPLAPKTALLGLLCAVVPFGPFWFDHRLKPEDKPADG